MATAKKKKVEAPKLKFKLKPLDKTYTVMGNKGTIVLDEKATQKELEYVLNNIPNGSSYVMQVRA